MANDADTDRLTATTANASLTDVDALKAKGAAAQSGIGSKAGAEFADTTGLYAALPFLLFVGLIVWFLSRR